MVSERKLEKREKRKREKEERRGTETPEEKAARKAAKRARLAGKTRSGSFSSSPPRASAVAGDGGADLT